MKNNKTQDAIVPNNIIDLTSIDLRIYDLEKDIKKLNKYFEELSFQVDDLLKSFDNFTLNIESKFLNNQKFIDVNEDSQNNNTIKEDGVLISSETNSLGNIVISSDKLNDNEIELIDESKADYQNLDKFTPQEQYQRAFEMLTGQKFNEAKVALLQFIENNENDPLSGSAHYWLGEIYMLKKEFREAALILAEGYQRFPNSIKAPAMLYKLSNSLLKINKKNDACNTLQKLIVEFPDNKLINQSQEKIVELQCIF